MQLGNKFKKKNIGAKWPILRPQNSKGVNKKKRGRTNLRPNFVRFCTESPEKSHLFILSNSKYQRNIILFPRSYSQINYFFLSHVAFKKFQINKVSDFSQ